MATEDLSGPEMRRLSKNRPANIPLFVHHFERQPDRRDVCLWCMERLLLVG